jgi:hypothetical protein
MTECTQQLLTMFAARCLHQDLMFQQDLHRARRSPNTTAIRYGRDELIRLQFVRSSFETQPSFELLMCSLAPTQSKLSRKPCVVSLVSPQAATSPERLPDIPPHMQFLLIQYLPQLYAHTQPHQQYKTSATPRSIPVSPSKDEVPLASQSKETFLSLSKAKQLRTQSSSAYRYCD